MMTLSDAMTELGIDATASVDDARRAYLRLLKTRKPDVDPAGFQRLREAYEILKEGGGDRAFDVRAPTTAPIRPPREEPIAPASIDVPERVARPAATVDQVAAACRKLEERQERGDWTGVANVLPTLYDAALRGDIPLEYVGAPTIDAMLGLQEMMKLRRSVKLGTAFQSFLVASGAERRVLGGQLLYSWSLLRELDSLPRDFSPAVRRIIVRAIARGDLESARPDLQGHRAMSTPDAKGAAQMLRGKFPLLARSFVPPLEGRSALDRGARFSIPVIVGIVVVRLVLAAMPNISTPAVFPFQKRDVVEKANGRMMDAMEHVEQDLRDRNCAHARRHMYAVRSAIGVNAPAGSQERVEELGARVAQLCKETGEAP